MEMKQIYVLNQDYGPVADGQEPYKVRWGYLVILAIVIVVFVPSFCGFPLFIVVGIMPLGEVFLYLVPIVIWVIVLVPITLLFAREYMLKEQGELIHGQIQTCDVSGSDGSYWLKIQYSFVTPSGKEITKKTSHSVKHLEGTVPDPGTPVAILYVNDMVYKVL